MTPKQQDLTERALRIAKQMSSLEQERKSWMAANPDGSSPGIDTHIAALKRELDELTTKLEKLRT